MICPKKTNELFDKLMHISDNGIIKIDSWIEWPKIWIKALTHWNEISWLYVFDYLLNDYNIKDNLLKWELYLILWNIEAHSSKCDLNPYWKRFIENDFNRIWWKSEGKCTESRRKNDIKNTIDVLDILFDLHSTSLPSNSMLLPISNNQKTKKIIDFLEWDYVLENIANQINWTFVCEYHKDLNPENISILFEAWQHFEEKTIQNSIKNTMNILSFEWCIKNDWDIKSINKEYFNVYDSFLSVDTSLEYIYSKSPKSFDFIKKWSDILINWDKKIKAQKDFYMIMPSKSLQKKWEEVFYYADKL